MLLQINTVDGDIVDHRGKEFILSFIAQHQNHRYDGNNIFYISSFEDTQARVHVSGHVPVDQQYDRQYYLQAGERTIISLPGSTRTGTSTGTEKKKGIRITANKPMSVQGLSILSSAGEGYLGLPVDTLGTYYIVPTFDAVNYAIVQVVAKEDNTTVSFKLRLPKLGRVSFENQWLFDGDTINVTLNDLDVFQVLADRDLSGTSATSSKPIAVFSGNDCATVPSHKRPCNHLVEQIPPVSQWGSQFITNPTPGRQRGDVFHVIASEQYTNVSVNSQYKKTLGKGEKYSIEAPWNKSLAISTTQPSLVVQYSTGIDTGIGSPSMSLVPPREWFTNDYTVCVPKDEKGDTFDSYINVIIDTRLRNGIFIKDVCDLVIDWKNISGGFSRASLPLTSNGVYHVYHKNPLVNFSAVLYSMTSQKLFAYPAGMKWEQPLDANCSRTETIGGDQIDNDCDGVADEELANGMDDDGDGDIDEDLATPVPNFNRPKYFVTTPLLSCDRSSNVTNTSDTGNATGSARGVCKLRGKTTITYKDINVNSQTCEREFDRVWTIKDSCQNVITRNQSIKISTPQDPKISFPDNITVTCREQKDLEPWFTGGVMVTASLCPRNVTVTHQDMYSGDCSDKEARLQRSWTVTDKCAPRTRKIIQVIKLLPKARPSIYYVDPATEVGTEKNLTLTCRAHGLPNPIFSWITPDGYNVSATTPFSDINYNENIRGKILQQDGSLLIFNTRVEDQGSYTCVASNVMGKDEKKVNVTVREDLVEVDAAITIVDEIFDEDLENKATKRYQSMEKHVKHELTALFKNIEGFQKVIILGFFNGSVEVHFRVVVVKMDKQENKDSVVIANKVVKTLIDSAENGQIGSLTVKPTVEIRERPPPPVNVHSADIKQTEAVIKWSHPEFYDMYAIISYSLQIRKFETKKWTQYTTQGENYRITSLDYDTPYSVRLKSENQFGKGKPSVNEELRTKKERSGSELALFIVLPLLLLIILAMAIVAVIVYRRWKKNGKRSAHQTTDEEVPMYTVMAEPQNQPEATFCCAQNPGAPNRREIPRDRITLGKVLGEGEFGTVMKGELTEDDCHITQCAVKTLKRTATDSDFKDLLNELEIMTLVGNHPNLVNLIGACSTGGPLMIVVEFAEHGNLLRHLRDHRKQNYEDMTEYTLDISSAARLRIACNVSDGMKHLAKMKCAHRDLSARNILLGEGMEAKVSDFGLSRDIYTNNVYEKKTGGKLPIKWMAVESLEQGICTSQSDVWSFGILLWEIETGGCSPYAGMAVSGLLSKLKAGYRLDKPRYCTYSLYTVMLRCWNANPKMRPTFEELSDELHRMLKQETDYLEPVDYKEEPSYMTVMYTSKENVSSA